MMEEEVPLIRGELQRTRDDEPPFDFEFNSQEELLDKLIEQLTKENKGEVPVVFICDEGKGDGFKYVMNVKQHSMASPLFMSLARHLHHNRARVIDVEWSSMFLSMAQGPVNFFPHAPENRELDCSLQSRVWNNVSKSIETYFGYTKHPVSFMIYQDPLAHIFVRYANASGEEIVLFSFLETVFKHVDFVKKDTDIPALENELEAQCPNDALDALDAFDNENEHKLDDIPCWRAMESIKPKLLEFARLAIN